MPDMTPNQQEALSLLDCIDGLEKYISGVSHPCSELRDRLQSILAKGNEFPLEDEWELDEISMCLRSLWLLRAHQTSGNFLKSPPHEQAKFLPSGKRLQYDYERSFRPKPLENRARRFSSVPKDWQSEHLLFSSGMGALSIVSQICCGRLNGPRPSRPVTLDMFGGYFETWRLLDFIHDASLEIRHIESNEDICERIEGAKTDAMLIEPVAYDWDMTVFDHPAFIDAWMKAGEDRPRVLIFDTSLTGHRFNIEKVLTDLTDKPPWLIVGVRSGLKLDQQGLELSNVGIVDLYAPKNSSPASLHDLAKKLGAARSVMGTGLTLDQLSVLEAPWFLNRQQFEGYGDSVFENNQTLAQSVNLVGGIFSKISHPSLEKHCQLDWAVAPFVVFHLAEDSPGNHGFLIAVLVHEVTRRKLVFALGSSFGFRGHRFEVIQPMIHLTPNPEQSGLLKVAMGFRKGASLDGVIQLINEIAAIKNFTALRSTYPKIKAFVKDSAGVYAERPPR